MAGAQPANAGDGNVYHYYDIDYGVPSSYGRDGDEPCHCWYNYPNGWVFNDTATGILNNGNYLKNTTFFDWYYNGYVVYRKLNVGEHIGWVGSFGNDMNSSHYWGN